MDLLVAALLAPILFLVAAVCMTSRFANAHVKSVRQSVTALVGLQFLLASAVAVAHVVSGGAARSLTLMHWPSEPGMSATLYYDGPASLMLVLVSFVSFIVCRFSIRYLDGEAKQGRYFRWLAFTCGAVSLMIAAGNLLLFFLAWVMTSFGLHQLLLHYSHRPAAQRAAWTKFYISRLGDAFLIAALVLTYKTFGTLQLAEIFASVDAVSRGASASALTAIGWLLVLGAVTKSAQFPFHTWLPETMETPTPVSALMHAGIVNAGGYLVIRMSPLIVYAPSALTTLALIGGLTACFAGVVMMTQSSIKRTLAYSTIAQMGFMMLQCGLGAFSAAMLHILAHSLYKAHAFLSSGSVLSQAAAMSGAKSPAPSSAFSAASLAIAAVATIGAYWSGSMALDAGVGSKPGGLVWAPVLCLALTTWGWRLFAVGSKQTAVVGLLGVTGLCFAYLASYALVDRVVGSAVAKASTSSSALLGFVVIALAFLAMFALQVTVATRRTPMWLQRLRVHAANGFYVDAASRRVFAAIANS